MCIFTIIENGLILQKTSYSTRAQTKFNQRHMRTSCSPAENALVPDLSLLSGEKKKGWATSTPVTVRLGCFEQLCTYVHKRHRLRLKIFERITYFKTKKELHFIRRMHASMRDRLLLASRRNTWLNGAEV